MAYEINNNSGSLFKNDRRQNDRQPEYTGTVNIEGKIMRISAWVRTAKSGVKYFSLAFDEPMANNFSAPQNNPRGMQQTGKMPSSPVNSPADEDIPF